MQNTVSRQAVDIEPAILGYQYLAQFISRPAASVRSDAYRNPSNLPPRVVIPGRPGLWWRLQDVKDWVDSLELATPTDKLRNASKRKIGGKGAPTKAERLAAQEAGMSVKEWRARDSSSEKEGGGS